MAALWYNLAFLAFHLAFVKAAMGPTLGKLTCDTTPLAPPATKCYYAATADQGLSTLCSTGALKVVFDPAGVSGTFTVTTKIAKVQHCGYATKAEASKATAYSTVSAGKVTLARDGSATTIGTKLKFPHKDDAGCEPFTLILSLADSSDVVHDAISLPIKISCTTSGHGDLKLSNTPAIPSSIPEHDIGDKPFNADGSDDITITNPDNCVDVKAIVIMQCMATYPAGYTGYKSAGATKFQEAMAALKLSQIAAELAKGGVAHDGTVVKSDGSKVELSKVVVPKPPVVDPSSDPAKKKCVLITILDPFVECPDIKRSNNFYAYPITVNGGKTVRTKECDYLPSSTDNGFSSYFYSPALEKGFTYNSGEIKALGATDFGSLVEDAGKKIFQTTKHFCPAQCNIMYERVIASRAVSQTNLAKAVYDFTTVVKTSLSDSSVTEQADHAKIVNIAKAVEAVARIVTTNADLKNLFAEEIVPTLIGSIGGKGDACQPFGNWQKVLKKQLQSCSTAKCGGATSLLKEVGICICQLMWKPAGTSNALCGASKTAEKAALIAFGEMIVQDGLPATITGLKASTYKNAFTGFSLLNHLLQPLTEAKVKSIVNDVKSKVATARGAAPSAEKVLPQYYIEPILALLINSANDDKTVEIMKLVQGIVRDGHSGCGKGGAVGLAPTEDEFCAQVNQQKWTKILKCRIAQEFAADSVNPFGSDADLLTFKKENLGVVPAASCFTETDPFQQSIPSIWRKKEGITQNGVYCLTSGVWYWKDVGTCVKAPKKS